MKKYKVNIFNKPPIFIVCAGWRIEGTQLVFVNESLVGIYWLDHWTVDGQPEEVK